MSEQCTASMSRRYLRAVIMTAFLGAFLYGNGCEKSGKANSNKEESAKTASLLCLKCGQIKGGDLCCKQDQLKCPKCGLDKDSPGCCKIPEDAEVAWICPKCGKIVTDKACCKCSNEGKCPVEEFIHNHKYPAPPT